MIEPTNRAQRRAMKHIAARKPVKMRPKYAPVIVGTSLVLAPLIAVVDQIARDGTVLTGARGRPVFQDGDGNWYETPAALEGLIWHLEMLATRHSLHIPLDALREFWKALDYSIPITQSLLNRVQADIPVLQRVMALASGDDHIDLLRQVQIKAEMEKA